MKWREFSRAQFHDQEFLKLFWNGKTLDEVQEKTESLTESPLAHVFKSGFKELKKLGGPEQMSEHAHELKNIERSLERASQSQLFELERAVGTLASVASSAPFIGLFGTVWGIMNSFQGIGASGSASLAVVAPGISEALIATAAGLVAAIPSVLAYNHFLGKIRAFSIHMEGFSRDYLNLVQRSVHSLARKGK